MTVHATTAKELLDATELIDIVFYEYQALRKPSDGSEESDDTSDSDVPIAIQERHSERRIEVRCIVDVETTRARLRVDAAARFESAEDVTFTDDALSGFVERVGLMAVYPYLREGIASLAAKLRVAVPTLRLIRGDQVSLSRIGPEQVESIEQSDPTE